MKKVKQMCIAVIVTHALLGEVSAEIPLQVNYQGRITDSLGNAVPDDLYFFRFRIYDGALAGTMLWDSDLREVNVTDGLFSYTLGDTVALPIDLFENNADLWLGVKVGTGSELAPRTKFNSVGFAFHSHSADTAELSINVSDNSITSTKIVDGTIQTVDLNQNGATVGQVLKWDGSSWIVANDSSGSGTNGWTDTGSVVRLEDITDSIGIGITNPLAKLHLEGDLLFGVGSFAKSSPPNKNIIMDNGTNDSPGIKFYYANNKNFGIDGHTQAGGGMRFVENLGESGGEVRMFLRNGGNIGIGTAYPSELLQITGGKLLMGDSVYSKNPLHPGDIIFENGAIDLPGLKFYYGNNKNFGIDLFDNGGGGLRFTENLDESPATTRIIVREGGNVGIGTLTPSEQLEVQNNIMVGGTLKIGDTADGYELPTTDGTNGQVMTTDGSGQLSWQTPTLAAGFFPAPAWTSPWLVLPNSGYDSTLIHNLGYDSNLYVVDMQVWGDPVALGQEAAGIGNRAIGNWDESSGANSGVYYHTLTSTSINVYRRGSDVAADKVRVRIWITP